MILLSWNLNRKASAVQQHADRILNEHPDLVALQEVSQRAAPELLQRLTAHGLHHHVSTASSERHYPFCQLIASRWPLKTLPSEELDIPFPERVLRAMVDAPTGAIELINVHVPAATSSGIATEVATFKGLHRHLATPTDTHRIVCGDFNSPRTEHPDGTVTFWGNAHQQQAERDIILGLATYGYQDAYRTRHGYAAPAYSWRASDGTHRRYDHVFSSGPTRILECRYFDLDEMKTSSLSDHSAIVVTFSPTGTNDRPRPGAAQHEHPHQMQAHRPSEQAVMSAIQGTNHDVATAPALDDVLNVITRRGQLPIPRGQLTLYKALYEAGPDGLTQSELAELIRWGDRKSLRGLLAALSKRVNGTKNVRHHRTGFRFLLTDIGEPEEPRYRLHTTTRHAIDRLPDLRDIIERPMSELLHRYEHRHSWPRISHEE